MSCVLRPAAPLDASCIGDILHRFERDTAWMPKEHSAAEAIAFCDRMIARGWVTVLERGAPGDVVGFLAQDGAEVCALYLRPDMCGQGLGRMLLDHAKRASAELRLWTFQANTGAQRFYVREGFVEVQRTDGHRNPERLPDIEYHWRATKREAAA
ncbi:GNAT family N-acetyltransferase [Epibacterium sp. Ofav1-8]|uniref:GNAT family N-acetyltransferase n=1 Tax=Epibacterium sp. Ofav1-8 TaxID=2917735 RepID=UPI001EF57901|nr:GNAT family N-acetyltransferase [Epibacterium sp. Ofav1-8]